MNEIDSLPLTMPRLLAWAAARAPERIALEEAGLQLDYAALDAARRRAAKAFLAAGTGHGDRVAIWAPNRHEWIVAATGAQTETIPPSLVLITIGSVTGVSIAAGSAVGEGSSVGSAVGSAVAVGAGKDVSVATVAAMVGTAVG